MIDQATMDQLPPEGRQLMATPSSERLKLLIAFMGTEDTTRIKLAEKVFLHRGASIVPFLIH